MLLQNKYHIKEKFIWLVACGCALPIVLNLLGIDFGFVSKQLDLGMITRIYDFENEKDLQNIWRGRYVHVIFVSFSIAISFLTIILAFIDFRIKGELSTPIVGVALFCSGLFYLFHVLVATNLLPVPNHQFYLTSFTWFFCRLFHASILLLGTSVLLFQSKSVREETVHNQKRFVIYISVIFVLLTGATIAILFNDSDIPAMAAFPYHNIARPYDLIPLSLYLFSGFYILPKFYEKYPSVFTQTLLLSMIPAIATQIYMAFGSDEMFDNNFNISHVMAAFTYFIPFIGLSLNYLQTYKNERTVIGKLNREVKERKTIEEILSGVLNSSLSSIMALNTVRNEAGEIVDFEWTIANPATQILFEINHEQLYKKKLSNEIPSAKSEGWIDMFKGVIETHEPLNHEYYSERFQKWLLMSGVKLEDGIAVTINDISKRKNALQKLMNAEKLTVTGRLARTIAHEVRNPLTNINLSIEHLKDTSPDDQEMYHDIIKRNSERINQLITELLNSSKPAELKLDTWPVNKLLDETLELAIDRIRLKEIKLEKDYCPDEIEINIDAGKVKTALLNLLINAIEAMEPGKGVLKISCRSIDHRCVITVEDNGSGIEKDHLEHLFEPFFSKKSKGMGLGLTATQNIILTHKGTVDVESSPGKGTKFHIGFAIGS
jgi:signal transduction histidine kinase